MIIQGVTLTGVTVYDEVISSGLVLNLDASNPASYPGTGTTWYDLSGQNNNVVMQNAGSISYTASGGGYFTTGSNGYFNAASTTSIPTGNTNYTLSAWLQLATWAGAGGIIGIGSAWGTTDAVNALRTNGTNSFINYWWANDLLGNSSLSPTTQWFNIVAKYDGTTRSIWVNGALESSDTPTGHNVTTSALGIGVTNTNEYLNGNIGQALIYNRALSTEEIQRNYNTTRSRYGV